MENKRLYHLVLQNYPDLLTRRRSEADLNVETPPADAAIEPAILPISIRAKKPKISESESNETKHNKGDSKLNQEAGDGNIEEKKEVNGTKPTPADSQPVPVTPKPTPGWFRQISTMTTTDHHYLRDMPLYRNTMMHRGAMMSVPRYRLKASSLPDMYRNSMESLNSLTDDEMVSALKDQVLDISKIISLLCFLFVELERPDVAEHKNLLRHQDV